MAVLRFISTDRKSLYELPISAGSIINCEDTGEIFYDVTDSMRVITQKVFIYANLDALRKATVGKADKDPLITSKIFVDSSRKRFYKYNASTSNIEGVFEQDDIENILNDSVGAIPATIVKGNKRYAPMTTASNTYLQDGDTVEERLSRLGVMSGTFANIQANKTGATFDIPVPFDGFFNNPNTMMVYIGTTFIAPNRYSVDGSKNTITFLEQVEVGRTINFQFFYTTKPGISSSTISNIDGSLINLGSIPTDRIEKTSNSYLVNDTTSLATSSALKNLFDLVAALCNEQNITVRCTAQLKPGSTDEFVLTVPQGYNEIVDGDILCIRFKENVPANAKIIYKSKSFDIYKNQNKKIGANEIAATDELYLQADTETTRMYLTNGMPYRMDQFTHTIHVATDTNIFSYENSGFIPGYDSLTVYLNGLRLIKGTNYSIDYRSKTITLKDFNATNGDTVEFVVDRLNRTRATREAESIDFLDTDALNAAANEAKAEIERISKLLEGKMKENNTLLDQKIRDVQALLDSFRVTTDKIVDGAITREKLVDDIINTSKIENNSITSAKIKNNAITTDKINNSAITRDKIADNAVNASKIEMVSILEKVYPIGSIYFNMNNTNPANLFGFGSWENVGAGRMLVSSGSSDYGWNFSQGQRGGRERVVLTEANMPAHSHTGTTNGGGEHSHTVYGRSGWTSGDAIAARADGNGMNKETSRSGGHSHVFTTNSKGGNQGFEIMNPYLTVSIWKRVG